MIYIYKELQRHSDVARSKVVRDPIKEDTSNYDNLDNNSGLTAHSACRMAREHNNLWRRHRQSDVYDTQAKTTEDPSTRQDPSQNKKFEGNSTLTSITNQFKDMWAFMQNKHTEISPVHAYCVIGLVFLTLLRSDLLKAGCRLPLIFPIALLYCSVGKFSTRAQRYEQYEARSRKLRVEPKCDCINPDSLIAAKTASRIQISKSTVHIGCRKARFSEWRYDCRHSCKSILGSRIMQVVLLLLTCYSIL